VRGRLSAAAGGIVVALGVYAIVGFLTPHTPLQRLASPFPSVTTGPASSPVAAADSTPSRVVIPAIGVDARIEPRGLDSNRDLGTASDFHDVAWYDAGPRPGEPGNAILNGHVSWWTGDAVFTKLARVRAGDLVRVMRVDGTVVTFKVTGKTVVDANARIASLFAPSARATLTLITCTGAWNPFTQSDTQRVLVRASLV
jgi:sortase A